MANKRMLVIILLIIFGFSILVSVPIIILSTGFSPYINVEGIPEPFEYFTSNTSGVHKLSLNLDVGDIEIQYTTTPVDFLAKIELHIEMVGQNLVGQSVNDYFIIEWDDSNTMPTFIMELEKDTDWFNTSKWIKQEVSILVTVNANILFNINSTTKEKGDFGIYIPGGTNVNNIVVNTKKGDIVYELIWCTLQGNITGLVDSGDITLRANNVKYTHNNMWDLTNNNGITTLDIIQSRAMGANLTGIGNINRGDVLVKYRDNSPNIGASFKFYNYSGGTWYREENYWKGFDGPIPLGYSGSMFTSYDFPSTYNYKLSFFLEHENPRSYTINLTSE